MATHRAHRRLEPSAEQLVLRLEADIAWLKRHRLWSRSLFERAVNRFVEATRSTAGLEAFVALHAVPDRRPSHRALLGWSERAVEREARSRRGSVGETRFDASALFGSGSEGSQLG
jgi:hypothetical protein